MKIYDYLTPHKTKKLRLGPDSDGGYVVAADYLAPILYSYGIGGSCSFEEAYIKKQPDTKVFLFDGTVEPPTRFLEKYPNSNFYQHNVYNEENLKIQHDETFVQMDIEGSEFSVFKTIKKSTLLKIKQLVIEVHLLQANLKDMFILLTILKKYFILVHIHANNFSTEKVQIGKFSIPGVLELTCVGKKFFNEDIVLDFTPCPVIGLDFPNNTDAEDIKLSWWTNKNIV